MVVAIDAHLHADGWFEVTTHGGHSPTGIDAVEWAMQAAKGGADIADLHAWRQDKGWFDIPLTRAVSDAVSVPVIASGGAGAPEHFAEAITEGHASAVLAASVFHFGQFTIDKAKSAMQAANIPVRRL